MKKIAALVGAGALVLALVVPAMARGRSRDVAIVTNSASAVASTGANTQGNGVAADDDVRGNVNVSGNNTMRTGDAEAYAGALVVANTHVGCGYCASGGRRHKDFAMVGNSAGAGAYTGENGQGNYVSAGDDVGSRCGSGTTNVSGNNSLVTGDATSRARAWTVVNTHISAMAE